MRQIIHTVDAFTDSPFEGNPAAVCILREPRDDDWRQDVAREMNLSETAFLEKRPDGSYTLRWFTPAVEVDLCGHATLASAHILWESGELAAGQRAVFHTRSGILSAVKQGDWIEMDFPSEPEKPADAPADCSRPSALRRCIRAGTVSIISSRWNRRKPCASSTPT